MSANLLERENRPDIISSNINNNTAASNNHHRRDCRRRSAQSDGSMTSSDGPDGGFLAWIIVLGSFLANGIIFGVINCYGVMFKSIQQEFANDKPDAKFLTGKLCTLLLDLRAPRNSY